MRAVFLARRAAASIPRATASESFCLSCDCLVLFMVPHQSILDALVHYRRPTTSPPEADRVFENCPNSAGIGATRPVWAHCAHLVELLQQFDSARFEKTEARDIMAARSATSLVPPIPPMLSFQSASAQNR